MVRVSILFTLLKCGYVVLICHLTNSFIIILSLFMDLVWKVHYSELVVFVNKCNFDLVTL